MHPQAMVKEAITTLKERSGSSLPAIKKVMSAKHPSLPAGWEKVLNLQLKKLTESKKLVKVRHSGGCTLSDLAPWPYCSSWAVHLGMQRSPCFDTASSYVDTPSTGSSRSAQGVMLFRC
jgi:hypothetical protein